MDTDKIKFIPPLLITINSDGNEIKFVGYNKHTSMYSYQFIKSKTKLNSIMTFTEGHLSAFIRTNAVLNTSQVLDNQASKKSLKKTSKK